MKGNIQSHVINLTDYQVIQEINRGGFGIVYLVENKTTRQKYAAKVNLQGPCLKDEQDKYISREIGILIRVQSPTIIRFYGFSLLDFNNVSNITILMEFKENGSLKQLIEKESQSQSPHEYDNTAKQIILCGVAHGMMILHSRRIIHRDLKPDNILLDSNYYPCITDFGLSKFLDPDHSKSQSLAGCGTTAYIAPEVLESNNYGPKADVYSFGILMYEVLTGERAFADLFNNKKFTFVSFGAKIIKGERPKFKTPVKLSFQKLIERCWSANPRERPSFRELFNKLSLSLEDDDQTIESRIRDIISDNTHSDLPVNEEEDFEYSRFCLDGVDYDRLIDYVDAITTTQTMSTEQLQQKIEVIEKETKQEYDELKKQNIEYQQIIKQQSARITELEQQNQKDHIEMKNQNIQIQQKMKDLESKYQQQIELLKAELSNKVEKDVKINEEKADIIETSDSQSIQPNETQQIEEKPVNSVIQADQKTNLTNPFEALTIEQIKEKIKKEKLTEITIPSSVTSLEKEAFRDCSSLTKITIPCSVTSIGEKAFFYCSSLTQITIPSSVTSIGERAFMCCESLKQIIIPSSVTSIGEDIFPNDKLENIVVEPDNPNYISADGILFTKDMKHLICYPGQRNATSYVIPSSVTTIDNYAFFESSRLKEITIPSSVTSIGHNSFGNCGFNSTVTIPDSVLSIGINGFWQCTSLQEIIIQSSLTTIEQYTFQGCYALTKITIPSSVVSIGKDAFSRCYKLAQFTIPSALTSIGERAFSYCKSITQIEIPSTVTIIESSLFRNCESLKQVTIPSSITTIKTYAFYSCTSLEKITIPSSVTLIGADAFAYCKSLTQITIPSSVEVIGKSTFLRCSNLEAFFVESDNPNYVAVDKILFTKDLKNLISYPPKKTETTYNIPSSVTTIVDGAFSDCSLLSNISIPSSVTTIGEYSFSGCSSLIKINIPSSVTKIDFATFSSCTSLSDITIPSSVSEIGYEAFTNCTSLQNVTIPSSVTSIDFSAFSKCPNLSSSTKNVLIERYKFKLDRFSK